MKINKLTKNFNFLESEDFDSQWKQNIIDNIQEAEKFNNPEENIKNVSNALECILNEFIIRNSIETEINPEYKLSEKISLINKTGRVTSSKYLFNIMHELRNARNFLAHRHNETNATRTKFTNFDLLNKLKTLFIIVTNLFDFVPEEIEFDEKCYFKKIEEVNIGAISNEQRLEDNKGYDNSSIDLKIEKDSIKSWLSIKNAKLVIPIYQRGYKWTEKNVKVLIEDIEKRMVDREEHYFGTIAQKKKISEDNKQDFIKIIDGQQRLTTSLLIISATRQIILERGYVKCVDEIDWYNEIIKNHYNKNKLSNYIYNPGGKSESNEIFYKILDNKDFLHFEELGVKKSNSFSLNYKTIYNEIDKKFKTKEDIYEFINTFLHKFKVGTISFDYNKFSNKREMEIFENLNSKGLELDVKDLIKNHLFNFCSDDLLNSDNEEEKIPKKYNEIISSARIEKELDEFFATIGMFYNGGNELSNDKRERFVSTKDSINIFLKEFKNVDSFQKYEKMMDKIKTYMFLYMESIGDQAVFLQFIKSENIVNIIGEKKKKRLFSYFLYIIYNVIQCKYKNEFDFGNSYEQDFRLTTKEVQSIQNLFLEVSKFIIRTKVITKQGDSNIKRILIGIASKYNNIDFPLNNKSIEEICKDIVIDIKHKYNLNEYSFNKFKVSLENNDNHNQIADLFVLTEFIMNETLFGGENIVRKNITIEHILPQNFSEWAKRNADNEKLNKEQFEEKANLFKEKIGNYLVLTDKKNSSGKNFLFLDKKNRVYKNMPSPLYRNNNDDIDISRKDKWTFEDIEKRTKALIDYITKEVIFE